MTDRLYNILWDKIVEKNIKKVADTASKKAELAGTDFHFHMVYDSDLNGPYSFSKRAVKKRYERIMKDMDKKSAMALNIPYNGKKTKFMEAAAICQALIDQKLFACDSGENVPKTMLLANYSVACMSGLEILYFLIRMEYKVKGMELHYKQLKEQKKLVLPGNEVQYMKNKIVSVAFSDQAGIDFNLYAYADSLALITAYNEEKINRAVKRLQKKK